MAESILQKTGGGSSSDDCTATKAQVLAGYTAVTSDSNDEPITGTMTNRGAPTQSLNCDGSYTIAAGYYSGGKVTANSLASQTAGNLAANKIIKGYYGWSNGVRVDGNITISSVVSFSVAAYSTSQVLCTWKNPAKGPYSGVAICAKTGGYPTSINDNRKYTGVGSNSVLNGTSTVIIGGLTAGTTYYFRIWMYCTCSAGDLYSGYLQTTCAPTAHGRQAYTSSGTFTVPAGVRSIDIHCTGGGGAGGFENYKNQFAGGGGGGGYTSYKNDISVTPGQNIAVVVGTGGKGGTWPDNESNGNISSATLNGTVLVSASGGEHGGKGDLTQYNPGKGGSGGGRGYTPSYSEANAGGSDGGKGTPRGAEGQGSTTKEFGSGSLYSGAGGGGASAYGTGRGAGGAGGGGAGGERRDRTATSGTNGSGGGGGGSAFGTSTSSEYAGAGGSGNVIIRW